MYTPKHFFESRLPVLHEMIRAQPFATLVANADRGPSVVHVPLLLDDSRGEYGVLQGHVARANSIWKELRSEPLVLALFQGPHHYISPNWYPAKLEHGKVVPTWNYVVVHARGTIKWIEEPKWLLNFLEKLTNSQEDGRDRPWRVGDAPADYIERMLRAIVGLEIDVSEIGGTWKLSQNRSTDDQAGVVAGLAAESGEMAAEMTKRKQDGIGT
jgi:transcriptional regulator